jgi:hypothetical protein
MVNLRKFTLVCLASFLILVVSHAQVPECGSNNPQCLSNVTPYAGIHGGASSLPPELCTTCAGDGRRVVLGALFVSIPRGIALHITRIQTFGLQSIAQ